MKKHKIIDAVFFYDELDMLTFRLTELNEHVDQFIIMESGIDFIGNSKPLIFKENEHLFEKWKDKISYLSFNELSSSELEILDKVIKKNTLPISNFVKETNRTNIQLYLLILLHNSLLSSDLYMEDIVMISDIDEIPDLSKLSEVIDNLDEGIFTKTGERGLLLSGGQRQRISLARAFYKHKQIFIFDESTSSLDLENSFLISAGSSNLNAPSISSSDKIASR